MQESGPVVFFDSGVGGLTVVSEFLKILPCEDILYLADEANMPYGNKSFEEIFKSSICGLLFLSEFKPKAIVIACGTIGSVLGARNINVKKIINCPVIRVIEPSCEAAIKNTHKKRIGVIATKATIDTHSYRNTLLKKDPSLEIFEKDCPRLASIIEEKLITDFYLDNFGCKSKGIEIGYKKDEPLNFERVISTCKDKNNRMLENWTLFLDPKDINFLNNYLSFFKDKDIDVLILGCTHYPLAKKYISDFFGKNIPIVNASKEAAKETFNILNRENLILKRDNTGNFKAYTTGDEKRFYEKAKKILPEKEFSSFAVEKVKLQVKTN